MLSTDLAENYQYTGCGLQICSHPSCWEATKRLNREIYINSSNIKSSKSTSSSLDSQTILPQLQKEESSCLSILNLLEDVQYEAFTPASPSSDQSNQSQPNLGLLQNYKSFSYAESDIVTKLHLKSLTQESASGITPAPANTPLHSSTIRYDLGTEENTKKKSSSTTNSLFPHSVSNLSLNFQREGKKRMYVWKSPKKREPLTGGNEDSKKKTASNLFMPLDTLPPQNNETSWRSIRPKKVMKPLHFTNIQPPVDPKLDSTSNTRKEMISSGIPREIERLRLVPVDVLIRVIKMALHNKILTLQQANLLMYQVTGQKYKFYEDSPDKAAGESKPGLCLSSQKKVHAPRNANPRQLSRTLMNRVVYKLDPSHTGLDETIHKQHSSKQVKSRKFVNPVREALTPNDLTLFSPPLFTSKSHPSAIKSRVGCVTKSSAASQSCPPLPKPFHYQNNLHSLSLHPLPTPPPSSPSTERDSKYNEVLGGSTVVVNPSFGDSARSFGMDVSERSLRSASKESFSANMNEFRGGSSTKSTLWPQVDEGFYLDNIDKVDLIEPSASAVEETEGSKLEAVAEASSDEHTIEGSPVPPPPSPVMAHSKQDVDTNNQELHLKGDGL